MKTKESRFQVHDELTAPEGSLPILKGALAAAGSSRTSSASWPARRPCCAPTRASAPSCATARCRSRPAADRARRRAAPGQRVLAPDAAAHRARGRARAGRDRARARVRVERRARGGAAALRPGGGRAGRRRPRCTSTRRRARPAGRTSRSSRRSPTWRWRVREPGHARGRRADDGSPRTGCACSSRLDPARRLTHVLVATAADRATPGDLLHPVPPAIELVGKRWTGAILLVLMDGPAALLRVQAARARHLRPAALRAPQGARGRGDRRAPRDRRRAGARSSTRSPTRARRSSRPCGAEVVGAAAGSPAPGCRAVAAPPHAAICAKDPRRWPTSRRPPTTSRRSSRSATSASSASGSPTSSAS